MPALAGCCPPAGKGKGGEGLYLPRRAPPGAAGRRAAAAARAPGASAAPWRRPGPGTSAPTAGPGREALGKPGGPSGGGGGASPGAGPRPHLVHLLKGTVEQEGNLLDR